MKLTSVLATKLSALASALIFSIASTGIIHAAGSDMPDEIASADSPAVRDTFNGKENEAEKKKTQKNERSSTGDKRDNSRYSTDGVERYDEDKDYSGTGPKLEDRY